MVADMLGVDNSVSEISILGKDYRDLSAWYPGVNAALAEDMELVTTILNVNSTIVDKDVDLSQCLRLLLDLGYDANRPLGNIFHLIKRCLLPIKGTNSSKTSN